MGWLRTLMARADPPLRSYGALARAVLESGAWPAGPRPQARSLAALFSKIDRRLELEWLHDRPHVKLAIADAIGRPLSDITQVLGGTEEGQRPGSYRMPELPYARALELQREPLCPGLPPELELPSTWRHLWWHVSDPDEVDLVEAWHRERRSCRVLRVQNFDEALPGLCVAGPLLLIVHDEPSPVARVVPERLLEKLELCVVASFKPRFDTEAGQASAFRIIESPPPESYVAALVAWVAERLPNDSRLKLGPLLTWLREVPIGSGFATSLGTLLGLCGAADELDLGDPGGRSLARLAAEFFERRLAKLDGEETLALSWLRQAGLSVLIDLGCQLIVLGEAWATPRTFDAWLALVPQEHQRGGDVDWMRLALAGTDSPVRPLDIARAAKRIPPGAYRVLSALSQAKILRKNAQGLLVLAPRWFARVVIEASRTRLLDGSPLEWGEALLNPGEAPYLLRGLLERVLAHDIELLEGVLELETEDDPAAIAALEASFWAVGMAILRGLELPQDLLENIWNDQLRFLVDIEGAPPKTRLLFGDTHTPGTSLGGFPLGTFYLAALAISEQLPRGTGRAQPTLRPWSEGQAPFALKAVYDSIDRACSESNPVPIQREALLLIDRLRSTVGQPDKVPHPLEWPGLVLDEALHEVLTHESLIQLERVPLGWHKLHELAEARGLDFRRVAKLCWTVWAEAGYPLTCSEFLNPHTPVAALVWGAVPVAVLVRLLAEPHEGSLPYAHFEDEHWPVLLETHAGEQLTRSELEAFRVIPGPVIENLAPKALCSLSHAGLTILWLRFGDLMTRQLASALRAGERSLALRLLAPAPFEATPRLVELLEANLDLKTLGQPELNQLRGWLVARTSQRCAGWPKAYQLLSRLEDTLIPLRALDHSR